jgi:hypothetical protein
MSKAKHSNAQQQARIKAFFGKARRVGLVEMVVLLAFVGVGVGLAESASTSLPPLTGGETATQSCSGSSLTTSRVNKTEINETCVASPTTTTTTGGTTTTTGSTSTTTTSTSTTTTTAPSGSSVAFVQADDTSTIDGTTAGISTGNSSQVLAHNTGIGHAVVLMVQTLPGNSDTDTITSISSAMGTFQFVNSYNDGADMEIWVCLDTTGASDKVAVNTPTNAWNAFAVEFNAPATGFVNGGGLNDNPPYLGNQTITVNPLAAGNVVAVAADTADAYNTYPAAPWTNYNSGYFSAINGTAAAWQVASSASPVTATWNTDGGPGNVQAVVLQY